MSAAVESMAYVGAKPWHGLGTEVPKGISVDGILKAAQLDWTVSKQPIFYGTNGSQKRVPGRYAIVRDQDDAFLSEAGEAYKSIQNADAMDFFTRFVDAGDMEMETAGSLQDGRYVWGLASTGKDFSIGRGSVDQVKTYLLLSAPHICGMSLLAQFTPVRVVCWNTYSQALGRGLKGNGTGFRLVHSRTFNADLKEKAAVALGLAGKQATEFRDAAKLLAAKTAPADEVEDFFCEILKWDPEEAKIKKDGTPREPKALPLFRSALTLAPGQALSTAEGTWWGAYNAVTYVVDHQLGKTRDGGLARAWFGDTAKLKRDALQVALEKAA